MTVVLIFSSLFTKSSVFCSGGLTNQAHGAAAHRRSVKGKHMQLFHWHRRWPRSSSFRFTTGLVALTCLGWLFVEPASPGPPPAETMAPVAAPAMEQGAPQPGGIAESPGSGSAQQTQAISPIVLFGTCTPEGPGPIENGQAAASPRNQVDVAAIAASGDRPTRASRLGLAIRPVILNKRTAPPSGRVDSSYRLSGYATISGVAVSTVDYTRVYVTDASNVYFSSDGGTSWSNVTGLLTEFGVGAITSTDTARLSIKLG
jgi:hypothetical protein